jgi:hypothetical protein
VLALLIAAAAVDTVICRRLSCCNYAGSASPLVAPLAAPLFAAGAASAPVFAPVSLVLFFYLYSVIVIIIMFVYVSTLFVVVNLDAPMAVRKTLFEGFSSSPHDASLHSCSM